jgi:hypothetical protein
MSDFKKEVFAEHSRNLAIQEWIKERIANINNQVTVQDVLRYHGISLRKQGEQEEQLSCPFHGKDKKPSARYYPNGRSGYPALWCFVCREQWDTLNLWKKFNGETKFTELLFHIEKAFGITPPESHIPELDIDTEYDLLQAEVEHLFDVCEKRLRTEREHFDLKKHLKLGSILDQLYFNVDEKKVSLDIAKERLNQVLEKIGKIRRAPSSIPPKP